jgi:hypothetical protein
MSDGAVAIQAHPLHLDGFFLASGGAVTFAGTCIRLKQTKRAGYQVLERPERILQIAILNP